MLLKLEKNIVFFFFSAHRSPLSALRSHDSNAPRQGSKLAYVFKMSTVGPGSGVDLVRRMQPGGDLALQFMMFDHVKRING